MTRLETLEQKVRALYEADNPDKADWADWLYQNHVFVVAQYAQELSQRFGAENDLAAAAAMLHDCADAVMSRFETGHEERSLALARELLAESGYNDAEIATVVDDAIRYHSCRDGAVPKTEEGKLMATADAKAHLDTNFYDWAVDTLGSSMTPDEIKTWGQEKIDRDFKHKIFYDDVRTELTPHYERVQTLFS